MSLNHKYRAHAIHSASGADRWAVCPGSQLLIEKANVPDKGSSESDEGTMAHEFSEQILRGEDPGRMPEGMEEPVRFFTDVCISERDQLSDDRLEFIEERVILNEGNDPYLRMFGTSDYCCADVNHCSVVDLKYGVGVWVNVRNTLQLLYYAAGFQKLLAERGIEPATYRLIIVQSRLVNDFGEPYVTSQEYSADEVREAGESFMLAAELSRSMALGEIPPTFNPGEKTCRWCSAKAICTSYREWCGLDGNDLMEFIESGKEFDVANLDDAWELPKKLLLNKAKIKNLLLTIEKSVIAKHKAGDSVGLEVIEKPGSRKVTKDLEALALHCSEFGVEATKVVAKSLAALEAEIGDKLPEDLTTTNKPSYRFKNEEVCELNDE